MATMSVAAGVRSSPLPHKRQAIQPLRPPQSLGHSQRRSLVCHGEPVGNNTASVGTESSSAVSSRGPAPLAGEAGGARDAAQQAEVPRGGRARRQADSTDWVASQLTRRFGIAGGLAWVGVLTFGVVSEQVKTRMEQASEAANTRDVADAREVVTPEGVRYTDLKVGGGAPPQKGYLIVLDYTASADGRVFEDTKARGKPIVFTFGGRPLTGGICPGVEVALRGMRAGGRRRVVVPPALGFGEGGATLRPTEHVPGKDASVPPNATLQYDLELLRVSIPPA